MNEDPWKNRSLGMLCRTCIFFVRKIRSDDGPLSKNGVGRCRCHAPTMRGYPVIFENDWCGDHKLDENSL